MGKILIEEYPDMDDLPIDINCANSKYSMVTPLSYLIGWTIHDEKILECVKIFIEKGCDLNGTRKAGRIPALIALGRYYKYPNNPNEFTTQIIDLLVKAGAKISHEFRFAGEIARFDMRMLLMYLKKSSGFSRKIPSKILHSSNWNSTTISYKFSNMG